MISRCPVDNLDIIKIKIFCSANDTVKRMKRQATDLEKIFSKDISDKGQMFQDKGQIFKMFQEFLKLKKIGQRCGPHQGKYGANNPM